MLIIDSCSLIKSKTKLIMVYDKEEVYIQEVKVARRKKSLKF